MKQLSFTTISICVVGTVAAILLMWRPGSPRYRLELKTYTDDARGLRVGAPVRIAGVDVGQVLSVRARTDLKESPAEIVLRIQTHEPLLIPRDAVVVLSSDGVLGGTLANIDVKGTTGLPAEDGAVLRSRRAETSALDPVVDRISKAASDAEGQKEAHKSHVPR